MEKLKEIFNKTKSYIIYIVALILGIFAIIFLGRKSTNTSKVTVDRSKIRDSEAEKVNERADILRNEADDVLKNYFENKKTGR